MGFCEVRGVHPFTLGQTLRMGHSWYVHPAQIESAGAIEKIDNVGQSGTILIALKFS